jgi:hypothetical protein
MHPMQPATFTARTRLDTSYLRYDTNRNFSRVALFVSRSIRIGNRDWIVTPKAVRQIHTERENYLWLS